MALPTPEDTEDVMITPEQPVQPEPAPPAPDAAPLQPAEDESVPVVSPETPASESTPVVGEAEPGVPEELVSQVQELIDVAFEKGREAAIQQARRTENAALVDALHASLQKPEIREKLESPGK